ncbi:SIS domain-containing protein [Microtetraspora niveoalba]|uniref:SIS domain-containing protein n=1 Tax=Microtetraspora niveoalba TaxID=46175 RepID=UPI0009FEB0E7|nr:SIS domain-containing protein [Microtetraspora niveoalba]
MSVATTMQLALRDAFHRRDAPGHALARDSTRIAAACRDMAGRFRRGGKLIVFGNGGAGADAAHIAVEFLHPVIVGKRALPALALSNDAATVTAIGVREGLAETFAHQLASWAGPHDIALGVSRDGRCPNVLRALRTARDLGLLTVALLGGTGPDPAPDGGAHADADHLLLARTADPDVVKEIHVTTYHLLWELTHLFLDHPDGPADDPAEDSAENAAEDTTRDTRAHPRPAPPPEPPCGDTCVTCSDQATPVTVVRLLHGGLALADTGTGTEEISVALVDATVGDTVLVHAGEAIAVVTKGAHHHGRH